MELNSRQLAALKVMGLPVWESRDDEASAQISAEYDVLSDELIQQLERCNCWVLIDADIDEPANRLLQSMMFAIGLEWANYTVINSSQVMAALHSTSSRKVLLVFGSELVNNVPQQFTSVATHSLNDLLSQPELKAQAWQDLRMARDELTLC